MKITSIDNSSEERKFGFIYSSHVFEHIPDIGNFVDNLVNKLASGGYFYIHVPNFTPSAEFRLFSMAHRIVHCHTFSLKSLYILLSKRGMSIQKVMLGENLHIIAQKKETLSEKVLYEKINETVDLEAMLTANGYDKVANLPSSYKASYGYQNGDYSILDLKNEQTLYIRDNNNFIEKCSMNFYLEKKQKCEFPIIYTHLSDIPPIYSTVKFKNNL